VEPYRGTFGEPRPERLRTLALPPQSMPARRGMRPLHAWRYVAVFAEELMLCAASIRIGPLRQSFWAVWDREARALSERTTLGAAGVHLEPGRLRVAVAGIDVVLSEEPGIETVCPAGEAYAWTRKQGGIPVRGTVAGRTIDGRAIVDDTAAYYPRRTSWQWCAGIGRSVEGREVAWNLVAGVNDPPENSERTVWIDGEPREIPPVRFGDGLGLRFHEEAVRSREENLVVIRSRYRQPFGTFSGVLPDGTELAEGYGVMEDHDAVW
jgi:uncharacterized protein DUF2804